MLINICNSLNCFDILPVYYFICREREKEAKKKINIINHAVI